MWNDPSLIDRRQMLRRAGAGAGMLALAGLFQDSGLLLPSASAAVSGDPLIARPPHFPARAKSVIWLFMNGGPSQVDTWDHKPELTKSDGKELPGFDKNTGFFTGSVGPLMKSPFDWARHGQSGTWVSSLFPHLARHVDKMAFLHSCHTESNNHSPALFMANTGSTRMGFPCVGSWATYGLGSESRDLPSFVVMSDPLDRGLPKGHASNWGAGFLPSVYQGTWLRPKGEPIDNLRPTAGMGDAAQRAHHLTDAHAAVLRMLPRTPAAHSSRLTPHVPRTQAHGPPAPGNVYLVNGDIADRGPNAVEIYLILFGYMHAHPGCPPACKCSPRRPAPTGTCSHARAACT